MGLLDTFDRLLPGRSDRARGAPPESSRRTLRDRDAETELDAVGYVVLPKLDDRLLRELRDLYDELGAAPDDPRVALNWSFHSASSEYKRAVSDRVQGLLGAHLRAEFDSHEPFLTTFIIKWPGDNGAFAPHQDPSLVDERRFRGVTVWIPLEDTGHGSGPDNGMLHLVPGSHRFSDNLRVSDVDRWQFAGLDDVVLERAVAVPMSAGEVLVFDNRVVHFSLPNRTDRARVVTSIGMRPAEASCVLLRPVGDTDRFAIHEIPDEFYLDVLPANHEAWEPPGEPMDTVLIPRTGPTSGEFSSMCESAPSPRRGVPTMAGTWWSDPGLFCSMCGGVDGLDDIDRSEANNAQLVCATCRHRVVGGSPRTQL